MHDGTPQSLARVGCPLVDELSSDVAPGDWVLGSHLCWRYEFELQGGASA